MCSPQHGSKDAHDLLSAHTRVRCASAMGKKVSKLRELSAHTRVRCASNAFEGYDHRERSQLIPACGVHRGVSMAKIYKRCSQLIPACGVHRGAVAGAATVHLLSAHTRVRCASAKATKMSCVHGFYMHNFYLIECIRKRFIIAESRTFSISGCRVTPADDANPYVLYWALHIRSDHNSL